MMPRLQIVLILLCGSIAGCGQVSVFGHTIGEKPASQGNADSGHAESAASEPVKPEPNKAEPPNAATMVTETTVPTKVASSTVTLPHIQKVKSVTIALTPKIAAQVADDSRFNADALLAAIKSELQTRKVLDGIDLHVNATAEVLLDEYSLRPTSNAIVFGNIISNGTLNGSIRLLDAQGHDLSGYRVEAATRVSIPASGESKNPLGPLYREFAIMTGHALDGTKPKEKIGADQHPR
jgi:hypothetical protein